jgi:hypothetical protein
LTATDDTDGATASVGFLSANFGAWTVPAVSKPKKKVTWYFSGFTTGDPIYGHYLHAGKVRLNHNFGTASGSCGVLTVKAKLYPGTAKFKKYSVQIDDSSSYSSQTTPALVTTLNFF